MIDVLNFLEAEEQKAAPVQSARGSRVAIEPAEGICFEIDRNILKVLLEKAVEVVPTKDMYPVLKNFQFRVRGGKLYVVSSNMSMSVISSTGMSVETKTGGVEVFPARKLLEMVRESESGSRVYIEVSGRTAVVVAGSASWEISLGRGADFPSMPKISSEDFQAVDRAEFLRALSTVKYAVGGDRETMMMVDVKAGRFTACDGSRLQQARVPGLRLDMKIPAYAIDTLLKMLKGSDLESLQVGEADNRLIFRVGTDTLLINKTASTFPPLEQLWLRPALSNDQKLTVEKNLLVSVLKRVKVSVDVDYNAVSLSLTPGSDAAHMGEMTVSSCDSDGNKAKETLPVNWSGPKREVLLHYRYLREMLNSYAPGECVFMLGEDQKTKKSPILLKDEESASVGIVQQMVGVPASLRR